MSVVAKRLDGSRCHLARRQGRPQSRPHCVRWGPRSPKRGTAPQFSTHICCGRTAGWIKMPLGTEIGLSSGDIVLDGDPAPLKRGTAPCPTFRPMSIVAKRSPMSATAEHLFGVVTGNIFSSVNKMTLTSLGECLRNCFEWLSFAWKFASLSPGSLCFLSTTI